VRSLLLGLVLLSSLVLACEGAGPADAGPDVPTGARCADISTIETCDGSECTTEACRGDEVCADAECVPWTEAELFADFTLATAGRAIVVEVLPGGFPREQVESLRFTFGDGIAGWGELVRHTYAAPGLYPVDLEVRLRGHRVLRASKLATIEVPEGANPLALTVDELPDYLNGTIPIPRTDGTSTPFTLHVPRSGFTIDVTILGEVDDVSLTADVAIGSAAAGDELAANLTFEEGPTLAVRRAQWIVGDLLPLGMATFTLEGGGHSRSITIEAVELPPDRDPFDRPLTWLFRSATDFFTTTVSDPDAARYEFRSTQVANGTPDLIEELTLLGAQGPDADVNAIYAALIHEIIRAEVYRHYGIGPDGTPHDGIAFTIVWEGEEEAPDPSAFAADGSFSMIRFGGFFDGFLGFSGIAPYNEERIDDTTVDRGVATASILGTLVSTPVVTNALDPIKPSIGEPVGTNTHDAIVLAPGYDPYGETDPDRRARHDALHEIARYIALAIAAVTAHEMGHAMGLVPNDVPPIGFFGGVHDVTFVNAGRTDSHHADLPGVNLMQAGGDYTLVLEEAAMQLELPSSADLVLLAEILALENRLDPLSRAYLQRRLTHASFAPSPSGYRVGCR
jgi:hypothetical protein